MIDEAVMRRSHTPAPSETADQAGTSATVGECISYLGQPQDGSQAGEAVTDRASCPAMGRKPRPLDGGAVHKAGRGRPVAGTETQAAIGRWYLWPREANARYKPWEAIARTGRGRPLLGQAVGGRC